MNRKADFLQNELIRVTNPVGELECSTAELVSLTGDVQCASVSGTTQQMLKNTTNYAMNCARYFTETTKLHLTSQRNQLGSRAFQFANWIRYANQFVL